MVIDPEPLIADLLINLLTDEGYAVYAAPPDRRALVILVNAVPALILVGLWRSIRHSTELIGQLQAAGPARTPIVALTTNKADTGTLLALGVAACLYKPLDVDQLLSCCARYAQPI